MTWPVRLFAIAIVLHVAGISCAIGSIVSPARQQFLERVDAAFASRDPKEIAALADVKSWREAGHPDLEALRMTLPKGPLTRQRDLSDTAVIYRDGNDRTWRLAMHYDEVTASWLAVVRGNACPVGGMMLRPGVRPERPSAPEQTWTVLECWPLPK